MRFLKVKILAVAIVSMVATSRSGASEPFHFETQVGNVANHSLEAGCKASAGKSGEPHVEVTFVGYFQYGSCVWVTYTSASYQCSSQSFGPLVDLMSEPGLAYPVGVPGEQACFNSTFPSQTSHSHVLLKIALGEILEKPVQDLNDLRSRLPYNLTYEMTKTDGYSALQSTKQTRPVVSLVPQQILPATLEATTQGVVSINLKKSKMMVTVSHSESGALATRRIIFLRNKQQRPTSKLYKDEVEELNRRASDLFGDEAVELDILQIVRRPNFKLGVKSLGHYSVRRSEGGAVEIY